MRQGSQDAKVCPNRVPSEIIAGFGSPKGACFFTRSAESASLEEET